ncbi:MAG: GntR family transcriptional regulator [Clostridiales bacterium]|nr:GntR family transcriptional regulator [Clostridiales bacterium]
MPDSNKRIVKKSAVDLVYEQMKNMIKNEEWSVADRIPSESDLAEMFDVNRLTVRMALQKLNTIGLVETRAGEGTFVTPFNFTEYIRQASEFYSEEMFEDIGDFRRAIELECCRLAMQRAEAGDFEELKQRLTIHSTLTEAYDGSDQAAFFALVDADLAFHEQICEMSRNSLLILAFQMAREAIYQYLLMLAKKRMEIRSQRLSKGETAEGNLHTILYEALVSRDFATCEKALTDMLNPKVNVFEI